MIRYRDLVKSKVHFDEDSHTYTAPDGTILSGVTSIIGAVLFPSKYAGIPPDILKRAAIRGTNIHVACQMHDALELHDGSPEVNGYIYLKEKYGIKMVTNEYLISDNKYVATMIDCIDVNCNIYDIKTTYKLDKESLSWQLSFCAYLFELQNQHLKVGKLYGVWLRGITRELVEVERKTNEEIINVLNKYLKMNELAIKDNSLSLVVSEKTLGSLTTNALQIKEFVTAMLPKYDVINYSEENIEQAKKDKAMLNKASKELNDKRIEIEKEFMKPFGDFKAIVSDTITLIKQCSSQIDNVVKGVDERVKNEKTQLIKDYFDAKEFDLVPFEKIFNEKWLNKSVTMRSIQTEIDTMLDEITNDIEFLATLPDDADTLRAYYLNCLSLKATITYGNMLKENREKLSKQTVKTEHVKEHPEINVDPCSTQISDDANGIDSFIDSLLSDTSERVLRFDCSDDDYNDIIKYVKSKNIEIK